MGLFEKIFGRPRQPASQTQWQALTAYQPHFTSWSGELYESDLVRSAIDALARHSSKLSVKFAGTARPHLRKLMQTAPNGWQTWQQFLYRARTILEMQNNCVIVPVLDEYGQVAGYATVLPSQCELIDVHGEPWLRCRFTNGKTAALPLAEAGILTKHQYGDDYFGDGNGALSGIMGLLSMQRQGIREGIKNGATFRFMAQVGTLTDPEDLALERQRFNENNLRGESGGLLLFPAEYKEIKQIDQRPFTLDAAQMELISQSVYSYFGVNKDVLQNSCIGDAWAAFYEGALEWFAIQLSEVLTRMTFTDREITLGNHVFVSANRLQYMSSQDKLRVSAQMADRGLMTRNEIREIWNLDALPPELGDTLPIRGEYYNLGEQAEGGGTE